MASPLVFMSHASADEKVLARLREALVDKTGGAIEFFLSTIPVGRSWPQEIEMALRDAKLMLCFVSPTSLRSQWVFFEAGYGYRQQIPVAPIAILGVEHFKLSPPLGLLQGITLSDEHQLNELIQLINVSFGHQHHLSFSAAEHQRIFESLGTTVAIPSCRYRVCRRSDRFDQTYESITLKIDDGKMHVTSDDWESIGIVSNNRYVGRFKYFRGANVEDMGFHDFTWNGAEFKGGCRFDDGEWESDDLIWKPESE